jgi:hypothetical protein
MMLDGEMMKTHTVVVLSLFFCLAFCKCPSPFTFSLYFLKLPPSFIICDNDTLHIFGDTSVIGNLDGHYAIHGSLSFNGTYEITTNTTISIDGDFFFNGKMILPTDSNAKPIFRVDGVAYLEGIILFDFKNGKVFSKIVFLFSNTSIVSGFSTEKVNIKKYVGQHISYQPHTHRLNFNISYFSVSCDLYNKARVWLIPFLGGVSMMFTSLTLVFLLMWSREGNVILVYQKTLDICEALYLISICSFTTSVYSFFFPVDVTDADLFLRSMIAFCFGWMIIALSSFLFFKTILHVCLLPKLQHVIHVIDRVPSFSNPSAPLEL